MYEECEHIEEFTYKELYETVDNWWNSLSEDAQYRWNIDPSPTFDMYVLTNINENDKVLINYDKHIYEIIN